MANLQTVEFPNNWTEVTTYGDKERQFIPTWGGPDMTNRKQQCQYCGSRCEDWRGNCGACGAPFDDDDEFSFPVESCPGTAVDVSEYMKPVTAVDAMRWFSGVLDEHIKLAGGADA